MHHSLGGASSSGKVSGKVSAFSNFEPESFTAGGGGCLCFNLGRETGLGVGAAGAAGLGLGVSTAASLQAFGHAGGLGKLGGSLASVLHVSPWHALDGGAGGQGIAEVGRFRLGVILTCSTLQAYAAGLAVLGSSLHGVVFPLAGQAFLLGLGALPGIRDSQLVP